MPRQKVLPSTLALATFQDDHFLGTIKHVDLVEHHKTLSAAKNGHIQQQVSNKDALFPPNSMLCAKAKGVGYAVCDPRVAMVAAGQRNAPRQPVQREASPHLSPTVTLSLSCSPTDPSPLLPPPSGSDLDKGDVSRLGGSNATVGVGKLGQRQYHPPTAYRKMKSHRGRHRMQAFNYRAYNTTPFVGLENSTPNSWNNPILQVLLAIPRIRDAALRTQISAYHHTHNPTSLLGELGFLFDMMLSISASSSAWNDVSNVATAGNFQRVFQCLPEANATGLFMLEQLRSSTTPKVNDSSSGEGNSECEHEARKIQRNVQVFTRFLLQLINKEVEEESKFLDETKCAVATDSSTALEKKLNKSIVDLTFGHKVSVATTFLVSNTTTHSGMTDVCSSVLELVYPLAGHVPSPSFSAVLWHSCSQTSFQRGGWCAASDSYEPFRQTRSLNVDSIGDFLVLLCGDTMRSSDKIPKKSSWTPEGVWRDKNSQGGSWLPLEIECLFVPNNEGGALYISELQSSESGCTWLIFNGTDVTYSADPASAVHAASESNNPGFVVTRLKLFGVVSGIMTNLGDGAPGHAHSVLHMRTKTQMIPAASSDEDEWTLFNDFAVMNCSASDATQFKEWRFPCTLFYAKDTNAVQKDCVTIPVPGWPLTEDGTSSTLESSLALSSSSSNKIVVPDSVLSLPSLSSQDPVPAMTMVQLRAKHNIGPSSRTDDKEDNVLVAFDAEFVSVSVDQVHLDSRGERVVKDEARQVLARISLLDGGSSAVVDAQKESVQEHESVTDGGNDQATSSSKPVVDTGTNKSNAVVLADDYVLPSEAVVDYVTRFSGLVAEDLDPSRSRHAVMSPRSAYLKLRYYLDAGCIFVGHGLQKDFETANIFVPPENVR
jgi:hypothetical protein